MMKSALLFFRKLVPDLLSLGYTINPYDPCDANKIRLINLKGDIYCFCGGAKTLSGQTRGSFLANVKIFSENESYMKAQVVYSCFLSPCCVRMISYT
jgi:hypothetical protein